MILELEEKYPSEQFTAAFAQFDSDLRLVERIMWFAEGGTFGVMVSNLLLRLTPTAQRLRVGGFLLDLNRCFEEETRPGE